MMDATSRFLQDTAEQALAAMRAAGFDQAQVTATHTQLEELNINLSEPTLLRSGESHKLALLGIAGGRMAATELTDLAPDALRAAADTLFADAASAPQDEANAVSAGQRAHVLKGPQQPSLDLLADKVRELLDYRAAHTPRMMIDEGDAKHTLQRSRTLTSGGSDLACSLGWYSLNVFGSAREGTRSSSFNYTGGSADDLAGARAEAHFGIADMLRDTERQIHTQPLGERFVGDVVFTPSAVASLLGWLHGQLGDLQLIAGSSLYRGRVGERIASPLVGLHSRFHAPGVAPLSADAFVTPDVTLLEQGTLRTLTPSLYGSRKTGLPHVPVAAAGWAMDAGDTALPDMLGAVQRGALVSRLSMGNPASNGDFSAVIKNSFALRNGEVGPALSETMIAGNLAQVLLNVVAVSRERVDTGGTLLPWVRVSGLHFS